jgi:hypothetical protein
MWLDALAALVFAVFIALGAVRGGLATGAGLLSLGAAYAAALAIGPHVGPALGRSVGLPEVLGVALAGALVFGIVYVGVGSTLRAGVRRRGGVARSPRDRFAGGVLGAVRGGLVVLLLAWLALWLEALRVSGSGPPLPALGPSTAAALTGSVVEAGVGAAIDDEGAAGRMVASFAGRPDRAIGGLHAVLENPSVEALREDDLFWTYVEHGSIDTALNRASFLRVSRDAELRTQLAGLGLIDRAAADDPGAFRDAIAAVLSELAPRLAGLRTDPQLGALLDDPQVLAMLREGDTVGLMGHSGFRQLVSRVAETRHR